MPQPPFAKNTEKPFHSTDIDVTAKLGLDKDKTKDYSANFAKEAVGVGADLFEAKQLQEELMKHPLQRKVIEFMQDRYDFQRQELADMTLEEREASRAERLEEIKDYLKEYNRFFHKSSKTEEGNFPLYKNGVELKGPVLEQTLINFEAVVLRNLSDESEKLQDIQNKFTEARDAGENIRYQVLRQQFENPELLQRMSPETYKVITDLKESGMSPENQLTRYFQICDKQAVEQGVLTPEEAQFYNKFDSQSLSTLDNQGVLGQVDLGSNQNLGQLIKSFLNQQNDLQLKGNEATPMVATKIQETVQNIADNQVESLPPDMQNQLNKAVEHQMKGGEQLELDAQRFTHDNSPNASPELGYGPDLRNRQQNSMSMSPRMKRG